MTVSKHAPRCAEDARVRAVQRYQILDQAPGAVLGRIAALAARSLNTPMAVVAIIDRDRIWYAALHGVEGGTRQLPLDDGLSAAVILDDAPYVVTDALAQPATADTFFVREHNVRFYAGAPIVTFDGHRLGAVAVMDTEVRTLSPDQLAILEDLAAVVMEQLELRLTSLDAVRLEQRLRSAAESDRDDARRDRASAESDRDDARDERDQARLDRDTAVRDRGIAERDRDLTEEYAAVLQRTLLPPSLPDIDSVRLASYFRPFSARRVGGDFYDVFTLGGNRWGYFIGDVVGHGADAAVVTSLIRYTLRSAALHYPDLVSGLTELNAVLLREMEPRRFCTVHFGTIDPLDDGRCRVSIATGGHPPGLLIDPSDGTVEKVRPAGGMLVGALPDATFDECSFTLQPGQMLVFYTDGLIESRRGERAFDETALAAFVADHAGYGAARLVDGIATLVPRLEPSDDIAVLAFEARA